jgi:phosphatidylinositol alpha-1,6-mannosyltransferase
MSREVGAPARAGATLCFCHRIGSSDSRGAREVLFVSKPVAPPWNDSSKNLVHDLAKHLARYRPRLLTRRGADLSDVPGAALERIYGRGSGGYTPPLADNVRVLARLAIGPRADVWHFFFAPNPRSSRAGRAVSRARRIRTVQTVCSAPAWTNGVARLFFADRTVVLSRETEARLVAAGVEPSRISRVPPAIEPLSVPSEEARREARKLFEVPDGVPLVVYPGDLEVGGGAARVVDAVGALGGDVHVVVACRPKTRAAGAAEAELRARAQRAGIAHRLRVTGATPHIHALLGAADVVALPSDDLSAKMDYPLVVLEAMSAGRATIVADGTPAAELADGDASVAVAPDADALATALRSLLDDEEARAALGDRARRSVLDRFDPKTMAQRYEAIYDEVLG